MVFLAGFPPFVGRPLPTTSARCPSLALQPRSPRGPTFWAATRRAGCSVAAAPLSALSLAATVIGVGLGFRLGLTGYSRRSLDETIIAAPTWCFRVPLDRPGAGLRLDPRSQALADRAAGRNLPCTSHCASDARCDPGSHSTRFRQARPRRLGVSRAQILFFEILPNITEPLANRVRPAHDLFGRDRLLACPSSALACSRPRPIGA